MVYRHDQVAYHLQDVSGQNGPVLLQLTIWESLSHSPGRNINGVVNLRGARALTPGLTLSFSVQEERNVKEQIVLHVCLLQIEETEVVISENQALISLKKWYVYSNSLDF